MRRSGRTRALDQPTARRRRSLARGRLSELAAAALLMAKGYRILARRMRTPQGEIDIIAARGRRLAFVEVKHRERADALAAAIGARQRERVRRAADLWVARHPGYREHDMCFDIIFVGRWRWPLHLPDAL